MKNKPKKKIVRALTAVALSLSLTAAAVPAEAAGYTVKAGDSFWEIAKTYGMPLRTLLNANPDLNPMNLQIGKSIRLPLNHTYRAKEGDTFWLLSKRFGIPVSTLMKANPNINPLNIYAGLVIKLPSTSTTASTAKATAASAHAGTSVRTAGGTSQAYSKKLSMVATAYSAAPEENGKWGAVDYMGNPLKLGTIAVDPDIIPMGSKVYITGYSNPNLPQGGMIAYANDQGGAIQGNRLDIFIPGSRQAVSGFGIQNVTVYVLK